MKKKIIFRWIKLILFLYALIGIVFYYLQDKIFFHPEALDKSYQFKFDQPFREVNLGYNEKSSINMVQFLAKDSLQPKGVVLYFHGNKRNIERYAPFAKYFTRNNYELWMMDYPGFGKSTGSFDEKTLYEWSLQFYKLARARFAKDSIVIYGKSLGTGLATQLASIRDCRRLILETPYYDFRSIANRYLFMYPLKRMIPFEIPTWQYLQKVEVPVHIFHGTDDAVIPHSNAKRLEQFLKPGSSFTSIHDGTHNNLYSFPAVPKALDSLLSL